MWKKMIHTSVRINSMNKISSVSEDIQVLEKLYNLT